MTKTTETIDKLFLELSQFSDARTRRELELKEQLTEFNSRWNKVRKIVGAQSDTTTKEVFDLLEQMAARIA